MSHWRRPHRRSRPSARECSRLPTDIRDDDQVTRLVDRALEEFGRIDTLVNNAGGQFSAPAEEITSKGWRAVHGVAVDAAWAVTREVAVRAMIPQRSGADLLHGVLTAARCRVDGARQLGEGRAGEPGRRALPGVEPIRNPERLHRAGDDLDRGNGAQLLRSRPCSVGGRGPDASLRHRRGGLAN